MSLDHVRIKEEVVWPDEGSSGFEVSAPMYEGLQPKIDVDLDLKAPKHENDCDAISVPEASLCKSEAIDNDFENLTSQVHVKDEIGSEMSVSETAELAALYDGCLVKEEMVIGPEMLQSRESPYFFNTALTLADPDLQATSNFNRRKTSVDEPFSCVKCLKKTKHNKHIKRTTRHKRTHMGNTFNCQTCQFINEKYLDFHIRVHTGERPYVCEVCDKKFAKKDDLIEHRHGQNLHEPLPCLICDKKFWRRAFLNDHKKTHTNEILFKCDVCLKQFNEESDLITHKLIHTVVRPFSCELCEKKFILNGYLISHMRQHTGKKPFSCKFCSKSFKHNQLLVIHMRNRHAQETLSCDTCFKEFANKDKLLEHIRKHGELTCDVCSKRFKRKCQLVSHKPAHTASR